MSQAQHGNNGGDGGGGCPGITGITGRSGGASASCNSCIKSGGDNLSLLGQTEWTGNGHEDSGSLGSIDRFTTGIITQLPVLSIPDDTNTEKVNMAFDDVHIAMGDNREATAFAAHAKDGLMRQRLMIGKRVRCGDDEDAPGIGEGGSSLEVMARDNGSTTTTTTTSSSAKRPRSDGTALFPCEPSSSSLQQNQVTSTNKAANHKPSAPSSSAASFPAATTTTAATSSTHDQPVKKCYLV